VSPTRQVLIDVNLTTDANFTFTDGTQTWHGLSWTGLHIVGNTDQFAVVNGTGLVIDTNANNLDRYLTVDTAPRIYLPFSQIPGYVHGATIVRVWFQSTTSGADANFEACERGIETIPFVSNSKYGWAWVQTDTSNSIEVLAGSVSPASPSSPGSTFKANCIEMIGLDEIRFWAKVPTAAAGDPNSSEFDLSGFTLNAVWKSTNPGSTGTLFKPADIFAAAGANLCAFLALKTGNTSNSVTCTYTRLRIEYVNP
jgi:hypothetical protein